MICKQDECQTVECTPLPMATEPSNMLIDYPIIILIIVSGYQITLNKMQYNKQGCMHYVPLL